MDDESVLPPIAAGRIRRQRASGVSGSLLSAPAAAALVAAGLEPVGEVMGCIVMHLSWNGTSCGGYRASGNRNMVTPVVVSGRDAGTRGRGHGAYVRSRYHAYDTVLERLLAETAALGADGAVGVTLTWGKLDSGARELVALGTAVRYRDPGRRAAMAAAVAAARAAARAAAVALPENPVESAIYGPDARLSGSAPPTLIGSVFCTELTAEDVAKLSTAGWMPMGIAIGLAVAVKHEDATMRWQKSTLNGPGNVEVVGLTNVITGARWQARRELTARAALLAPDGQVVVSQSALRMRTSGCQDGPDHVAEATLIGTLLARSPESGTKPAPGTLSLLPLR